MKKLQRIFILIFLTMALAYRGWAEEVNLEKIVVTPSRIEQSYRDSAREVDIITAKDIETQVSDDLSDVLTNLSSVNISDYGGLGANKNMRMRGSSAAQVLVMVDGRPVNNSRDGQVDLSTLPLDNIAKVEVMRGPGSSLYGSSAMGGTINIITKRPPKKGQKTELTSSFGTFRTYNERFSHGARVSNLGYLLTSGYQSSEGFRDNGEFNAKDTNAKFEYELNDSSLLTLNTGFYKSKVGAPGQISAFDSDDKQKVIKNFQDLSLSLDPDPDTQVLTKLYSNYDRLEFIENTAGSIFDVALNKDIHTTKMQGLDLQVARRLLDPYQVVAGFNYVKNINDSTTSSKHEYLLRAIYLENQWDFSRDSKASVGVRVDDYSNFGSEVNPTLSLMHIINEDFKLHFLVSRSFRAPTFNDLFWPDQGWVKGNPNLRPEKAVTGEFGIDAKLNKYISPSLTYYHTKFTDLINWAEANDVWQPTNIGTAVVDGIEFENKFYLPFSLEFGQKYTYLRAKDSNTHKDLNYRPRHKIDTSLRFKEINGFVCEIRGQLTDKRYHDAENTIKVKRFYTLGVNASKKFKSGLTCFMDIENILNKTYQVIRDFPMPGFSLTGGVKLEF